VRCLAGALALGDIGHHFPPDDPAWADADSRELLRAVHSLVAGQGYRVGNVDSTVICERPKLAPYLGSMRACTAEDLAIDASRVSIKATTTERLGYCGREEGIAAQAIVCLFPTTA
jgi:2-C-methyl-D-erythritol 2,4-cyclodiphosphate synthase